LVITNNLLKLTKNAGVIGEWKFLVIYPVAEHWIGDEAVLFPPGHTPQKIAGLEIRVAG